MENKNIIDYKLYIYADFVSQPVRSVVSFCNINKIEYEIINTYISKGEHLKPEFLKKVNPNGKLPSIKFIENDKEFYLSESTAIIRFLAFKLSNLVDEKWYNRIDLYRRAKIDQYLDFHHENTRRVLAGIFYHRVTLPLLNKMGIVPNIIIPNQEKNLPGFLRYINERLDKQNYIVDDEISIGDIMLFHELAQLLIIGIEYSKYPNISKFIHKVGSIDGVNNTTKVIKTIAKKKSGLEIKF